MRSVAPAAALVLLAATSGTALAAAPGARDRACRAALGGAVVQALARDAADGLPRVTRRCRGADATLAAFPDADPGTALAEAVSAELAARDAVLLRPTDDASRAARRCRAAILAARRAVSAATVRDAVRCQHDVDRGATRFTSLNPGCAGNPGATARRVTKRLAAACRGTTGPAIGSCDGLPGCAVAEATAAGRAVAAVTFGATPGARLVLDLSGPVDAADTFWNLPWPSDLRLRDDGRPDLTGYPVPAGNTIVAPLRAIAEDRPAFPLVAVAYFRFTTPGPAPQTLAVEHGFLPAAPDQDVLLIDVDPASPTRGRLFPVTLQTPPVDPWVPEGLLAVGPMPGTILPPGRRYAVVVRRTLGGADGAPLGVPLPLLQLRAGGTPPGARGAAMRDLLADAWDTLATRDVRPDEVAAITVFTTGDVVNAFAAQAEALRQRDGVDVTNLVLDETHERFCELRGQVDLPQYQVGIPDFDSDGDFELGPDGLPILRRRELAPVVVTIPRRPMPVDGFPLVLYLHGSAGLAAQVVDRGAYTTPDGEPTPGEGPAFVLAAQGIAAVGAALPLNPERLPGAEHRSYLNFENLGAYPFTFRQGTIEQRMILDALARLSLDPAILGACTGVTVPGGTIRFATDRVGVQGQSMGAQYANMLAAVEPRVAGVVPTGSGGLWGFTFLEAQLVDDQVIRPFVPSIISGVEPLTLLHPAFNLLETAWEWAETAVYAPRIARDPLPGHPQRGLYLPVADDDPGFPSTVYTAMALASGVEQAGTVRDAGLQDALATQGLDGVIATPATLNVTGSGGVPYTGVVVQFHSDGIKDGHYIAGQLDTVKRQTECFFASLLDGGAAVVPPESGALGSPCPD